MTKYDFIYQDCIQFWMRMGVKKEDNLMVPYEQEIWDAYYRERFEKIRTIIMQSQFDENRGREGFLAQSGL